MTDLMLEGILKVTFKISVEQNRSAVVPFVVDLITF